MMMRRLNLDSDHPDFHADREYESEILAFSRLVPEGLEIEIVIPDGHPGRYFNHVIREESSRFGPDGRINFDDMTKLTLSTWVMSGAAMYFVQGVLKKGLDFVLRRQSIVVQKQEVNSSFSYDALRRAAVAGDNVISLRDTPRNPVDAVLIGRIAAGELETASWSDLIIRQLSNVFDADEVFSESAPDTEIQFSIAGRNTQNLSFELEKNKPLERADTLEMIASFLGFDGDMETIEDTFDGDGWAGRYSRHSFSFIDGTRVTVQLNGEDPENITGGSVSFESVIPFDNQNVERIITRIQRAILTGVRFADIADNQGVVSDRDYSVQLKDFERKDTDAGLAPGMTLPEPLGYYTFQLKVAGHDLTLTIDAGPQVKDWNMKMDVPGALWNPATRAALSNLFGDLFGLLRDENIVQIVESMRDMSRVGEGHRFTEDKIGASVSFIDRPHGEQARVMVNMYSVSEGLDDDIRRMRGLPPLETATAEEMQAFLERFLTTLSGLSSGGYTLTPVLNPARDQDDD